MWHAESILKRVPGLDEWMNWIDCRGLKKAAVTNAPKENARVMLAALGMDNWFDEIILGENCKMPKPHPDPYLAALEKFGIEKDEALICEDSPSGTFRFPLACFPIFHLSCFQPPVPLAWPPFALTFVCCVLKHTSPLLPHTSPLL